MPTILFVAVFITSLLKQEFTFLGQENTALFLLTPDYMRETFSAPFPLSHLLGNFLAQFFRFAYVGPAIAAGEITLIFLLMRHALRRIVGGELAATTLTCVAWWFSARANNPSETASFVLFSGLLCAVSVLIQHKMEHKDRMGSAQIITCIAVVAAAAVFVCTDKTVVRNENVETIEQCSFTGKWDKVLEIATPDFTAENPEMLPYALLALNYKGNLRTMAKYYPLEGQDDLEGNGYYSYHGYMSGVLLYNALGSRNESIHRLFQAASYLPHGSSFLTLRTLIAHFYELGDYTLAKKYCDILSRSTAHKKYVSYYRAGMEGKENRKADSPIESSEARIMSHTHSQNLKSLQSEGVVSGLTADRFALSILLEGRNR